MDVVATVDAMVVFASPGAIGAGVAEGVRGRETVGLEEEVLDDGRVVLVEVPPNREATAWKREVPVAVPCYCHDGRVGWEVLA